VKQGDKVMPGEVLIDIEESIEKNETGTPIQEAS
jgi:exosome complex RNA-binding protein Csl4